MKNPFVRQSERTLFQRFFLDPVVALVTVTFFGMLKILPYRAAVAVGGFLGGCLGYIAKRKNKYALYNLSIAFPDKTLEEKKRIIHHMWVHFGRMFAETIHIKKVRYCNMCPAYFEQLADDDRGGFCVSAHMGNWELISDVLQDFGINVNLVYRSANNPWLEKLLFKKRRGTLIPKGREGARQMIELLKHKEHISLLCDQKLNEGIEAPFFGHPARNPSAIISLALKMQLPILVGVFVRQPDGSYNVYGDEPFVPESTGDLEKDTYNGMVKLNTLLEKWIRKYPEQWLWIHRRFDKKEYR